MVKPNKIVSPVVGLDVGGHSIKAVQVRYSKGKPVVEKVGKISLPWNSVSEGRVLDEDAVILAIKELWKKYKFSTNNVRASVGGKDVFTNALELDWMEDQDLFKALPYVAAEKLLISNEEYFLDFHALSEYFIREESKEDPDEKIRVKKRLLLATGARKDNIETLARLLLKAGLKPLSIDLSSLSLIRIYDTAAFEETESSVDVSVDIGADSITIALHKFGQPLYIREVSGRSGNSLTQKISEALKTSLAVANTRKIESLYSTVPTGEALDFSSNIFNAASPDSTTIASAKKDLDEEAQRARNSVINPLLQENISGIIEVIRETINDFMANEMGQDLDELSGILLSGGVSETPGVLDRISAEFRTAVAQNNPFSVVGSKKIAEEFAGLEHEFAIATGTAIGRGSTHD